MDSDDNVLSDTAHYYMECSNKGLCDRKEGTCKCYPGYSGPDCSGKDCKYGIDPHYVDDDATARISEQFYEISGGSGVTFPADAVSGTYAIKFYDVFGEDYVTEPITISTVDTSQGGCSDVVAALEGP